MHADALGRGLLLGGERARSSLRLVPGREGVDRRLRAVELHDRHRLGQRVPLRLDLPRLEAVLLEVLDAIGQGIFRGRRPAARGDEDDEEKGGAHRPTHSERGTSRAQEV